MTAHFEREVVGALLLEPWLATKMASILECKDFQDKACAWIFQTICDRVNAGEPVTPKILMDMVPEKKRSQTTDFITSILENTVTSGTGVYYARKVREETIKRQIRKTLDNGADHEALLTLSQALSDVRTPQTKAKPIIESMDLLAIEFKIPDPVIASGILPEGAGLILAGESGDGKSMMRLELAIHMALGLDHWGLRIPVQRRVFIMQFENTLAEERFRLGRMLHGLGIDGHDIMNRLAFSDPTIRLDLGLKGDRKKAFELVKESKAEVIIWDPLSSLHSKNENDNIEIRAVLDSITHINRETGSTSIVVHHFGKPQEGRETQHRTRGASSIRDWSDTLIAVTRNPHSHKIQRLLTFIKIRNGPQRPAILLERDDHFLNHIVDEESLCAPEKVREILMSLGGGVGTQSELAQAITAEIGCSDKSARKYIRAAKERGFIKETKGGHAQAKGYIV